MENAPTTSAPHLTKFNVSNVKPKKVQNNNPRGDKNPTSAHPATYLKIFKQAECEEILAGTSFSDCKNIQASDNGFVYAAIEAYNSHHHLILRPDDIWLAIMTQFSFYINANAEEFRSKFVNFDGKKELVVSGAGSIRCAPYDWLVLQMEEEIHKNLVDEKVRNWIMPNFSTTAKEDRVTAGVVFMAAMKKYFEYKFCLCCGIPSVSLDGILEDWKEIRNRLNKLDDYNLTEWKNMLIPVIDEFVNAKAGNFNKEFWERIAHYNGGGSGPTYLSGWITAFIHFDPEGKKQGFYDAGKEWPNIDTSDITSGVVQVDVIVDDNGTEYRTVMLAGSMAQEIGQDEMTLQPKNGWIIALKKENKEGSENPPSKRR